MLITITYLKVTIIYGDNILRIGGIAHFARIKFCAYAACASGVALLFPRALVRQWYAHKKTAYIVYTRCTYHLRTRFKGSKVHEVCPQCKGIYSIHDILRKHRDK